MLQQPTQFTLLRANTLSATGLNTDISADTPFLFISSLNVDQAAGLITVDVRRRTAEEAGIRRGQSGAFDAVYAALASNEALRTAFLNQTTRETGGLSTDADRAHGWGVYSMAAGSGRWQALRDGARRALGGAPPGSGIRLAYPRGGDDAGLQPGFG